MSEQQKTFIHPIPTLPDEQNLNPWLVEQAKALGLKWLLALAENGVIWGYFEGEEKSLHLSSTYKPQVSPALSLPLLQRAHLFGETAEVLLWRTGLGWQARSLCDSAKGNIETFDTQIRLWGNAFAGEEQDGFICLREGEQGLLHTPPLHFAEITSPAAQLIVRNYLQYDKNGLAFVRYSRLVDLKGA